jgi:hypothetical protein
MPTFANIIATTAATSGGATAANSAPYGVWILNHPSNAADCVLRIGIASITASITTQGWALKNNTETYIAPYFLLDSNGTPNINQLWIYATTTGQTACVRY